MVLLDGAAGVNILYKAYFDRIDINGLELSLNPSHIMLFSDKQIQPVGKINLPIIMEDEYGL